MLPVELLFLVTAFSGGPETQNHSSTPFTIPERAPAPDEAGPADPRVESAWLDAAAAISGPLPARPDPARISPFVLDRAMHAADADGTPWVRAPTYMARFGAEGATYTPYLGSDAPRTWPVRFALARATVGSESLAYDRAAPSVRSGEEFRYERGGLSERYAVATGSIEQVFVLDELPVRGEIVLRIAVETDLTATEMADAIEFSNERGAVRYGRATALDASGASVSAATTLIGDEIEIRVPASFVATASLPLVIDPLISTYVFGSAPSDRYSARDCAFDATHGRWLILYDDEFFTDGGPVFWRLAGVLDGQTIASGLLGDRDWFDTRCANNNASNQFLVVGNRNGVLLGQSISAANGVLGPVFTIQEQPAQGVLAGGIQVGGDPYPGTPSFFLVSWVNDGGANGISEVRARLVGASAPAAGIQVLRASMDGRTPRYVHASKSNSGSSWNLIWKEFSGMASPVYGARVSWNGSASTPQLLVPNSATHGGMSVASSLSGSSTWAFAYTDVPDGGAWGEDVNVGLMNDRTLLDVKNVSLLIEQAGGGYRQGFEMDPQIDCDGRSFCLSFVEDDWQSSEGALRIATLTPVGTRVMLSEILTAESRRTYNFGLASTWGAGLAWRLQLALYGGLDVPNSNEVRYDNALFTSFCHPGYEGVTSCPCGNAPSQYGRGCNNSSNTGGAKLYGTGISSVSSDSMQLVALNLPVNQTVFFYQGTTPLSQAVFSGQGVRCVGGTQLLLYTKPSYPLGTQAYATAPTPGDPRIAARSAQLGYPILAGQTRYYYASYRPTGTSGGGSGTLSCNIPYAANVTQAVQAVWIP